MRRFRFSVAMLAIALLVAALVAPAVALATGPPGSTPVAVVDVTKVATLAAGVWALTGVLKRIPALKTLDAQVVALCVAALLGVAAYVSGYITGNPIDMLIATVMALFGGNLLHDKVSAPFTAQRE